MASMIKFDGVDRLVRKLSQDAAKRMENPRAIKGHSVIVGYMASYALYVHENLSASHNKGQQAKFLERPSRELQNDGTLSRIVTDAQRGGVKLQQALAMAALRIQRESQEIVPVDTGNLKASAFTRKE